MKSNIKNIYKQAHATAKQKQKNMHDMILMQFFLIELISCNEFFLCDFIFVKIFCQVKSLLAI